MNALWFTVGVPAVVGFATAPYATGGRSTLARRAIQQDLQIAALLPDGTAREAMERLAEEKTVLYASRWVGPQTLTLRGHAFLLGTVAVAIFITWGAARLGDDVARTWLVSFVVLAMLIGMAALALASAMWISLMVMADNAKTRVATIETRSRRVEAYVRDRQVL